MPDYESKEFITAVVVGTLLGVGAALMLRRDPPTRRERLVKELEPYGKALRKNAKKARRNAGRRASATADAAGELVEASRDILAEFRDEVAEIVNGARDDIGRAVSSQVKDARKTLRKTASRVR